MNKNDAILKRLCALGLNDEIIIEEYKSEVALIDALLIKAQQKSIEIEAQINHAVGISKRISKAELLKEKVGIDIAITITNFNAKIETLQNRKKIIDDTVISIIKEINKNEKKIK